MFFGSVVKRKYNSNREMLRLIFFVTCCMLTFHESQCVTCTFKFVYETVLNRTYGCELNNQIIEGESDLAVVNGSHYTGYTDQHVTWISSHNSRILFFPSPLIEHFPNVKRAMFDESQMTSFGQRISCNELDDISLNGNLLSNIPDGVFANCFQLKRLSLNGNNFESIGEHSFSALTDLQSLHLQRNNLSSIHPNSFRLLVNLTAINLGSNNLETVDPDLLLSCWQLQVVRINENRITSLSDEFLINSWQLYLVDLSQNRIDSVGPKLFGGRFGSGSFNLSYTLIEELPVFDLVSGLRQLYFNNNKIIRTLPGTFVNLTDLFVLRLDHNQIDDLQGNTFGAYSSVRHVYLNSNNILYIPFHSFHRTMIMELWLSDNQLNHISVHSFAQMPNLHKLHVERNRIQKIDRNFFDEVPFLGTLSLAGNICANDTFRRNSDSTWPRIGTCSSVRLHANVIALVMILLIKIVI